MGVQRIRCGGLPERDQQKLKRKTRQEQGSRKNAERGRGAHLRLNIGRHRKPAKLKGDGQGSVREERQQKDLPEKETRGKKEKPLNKKKRKDGND